MSFEDPTDEELRLLAVLIGVCGQHMPGRHPYLDHQFMSAGEHAVHLLARYGMIVPSGGGGVWTTKANAVESLDDIDLSNIDEIRSQLRALPDGELLPSLWSSRPHHHDVKLDHLRLWFPCRANAKYRSLPHKRVPAADRLEVEVRLEAVDAVCAIGGEILTIAEVQEFRDQLAQMVAGSSGRATLISYKSALEIHLKIAAGEMIAGEITVRNPNFDHALCCQVKRLPKSALSSAVEGFDRVLARFSDTGNVG